MPSALPQPDPRQRKGQSRTVSVAISFELHQKLAQKAQLTGESVASYAARLLSTAIGELPADEA